MKRDSRVGPVSLCNVEVVCVRGGQVQPSLASPMTTGGAAEQGEAWHTTVCVLRIPDDTVEVVRVRGGQAQPSSASPMIAGARWSEARRGNFLCDWCSGEDHSVWCRGSTLAGPPALRTPKHTRSLAHLPTAHRPASPRPLPRPPPSIPATTLTPTPTAHRPSPAARHPATRPPGHPTTRPPAAPPHRRGKVIQVFQDFKLVNPHHHHRRQHHHQCRHRRHHHQHRRRRRRRHHHHP